MVSTSCDQEDRVLPKIGSFVLVYPALNSVDIEYQPIFKWAPAENATYYDLVVSKHENLIEPIIDIQEITGITYETQALLENGTNYYWQVRAIAKNENEEKMELSPVFSFRTEIAPPSPSPQISKYFVSPQGIDNPDGGTMNQPFKTLGYAAKMIPQNEGDTIFLKAGEYIETEPAEIPEGVSVIGEGQDLVILKSSGVSMNPDIDVNHPDFKLWYDGALIQLVSPNREFFRKKNSDVLPPREGNQVLANFTIDGDQKQLKAGLWVENRHNVTLHHVSFKDIAMRGAVVAAGDKHWFKEPEYYLKGIKIHDCVFENAGKDLENESVGNLNIAQLDGAEIYNIDIKDNEGYGLKFIYDGYFKNCIFHNISTELSESDQLWGEDIGIELWNLGPGNELYNIEANTWLSLVNHAEIFAEKEEQLNFKLHEVKIIDLDGESGKEGIEVGTPHVEISNCFIEDKGFGIAVWNMGREDILIRNNIIRNNTQKQNWAGGPAIYIDNSQKWDFNDIKIYNNVFYNHHIGVNIQGERIKDIFIKNNLFILSETAEVSASTGSIYFHHNYKYQIEDLNWYFSGEIDTLNNYSGDPLLRLIGEKWDTYYQPVSRKSPLIDAGEDVGIKYLGNAPDIGFFEKH
ncbi:right-handed parallel beta-helix repeat-containing protein [Flexithrix dorotheae]|uniref:right-handed parallel beta-helix repeat-containing protein n=1 Tax=Flexithrix dorotheae TaxID=70993 RepID=UPI0004770B93|nr:right-handed parallel beta-helix repeat-containing protein [Flexithrix dorotheae]